MIGERLQEIRKDHGDTQQALADKLHASLYAVRCWEQGKSDPSHDTLISICRLYRISADYLLGITDDPAPIAPSAPVLRLPAAFPRAMLPELKIYADFLVYRDKAK
ncbi:MAG: helix-turn-helix domain-containing protein [Clostridiales bacterium]|nr:helix-turn-helix domain-containing protein [Clostridiales bacterium]